MYHLALSACAFLMTACVSHAASWTGRASYFRAGGFAVAHRTLPVGTHVHVTNLHNGKSVIVIVKGRGPFIRSRIIDVSTGATDALGFRRAGTAMVRIQTRD
ncbi:MAG: hypothetical protein JOZ16_02265 [Methylobacteriaceae bacterium]|nr:hypothetical protein [Methylobacteriaceae bacterium]